MGREVKSFSAISKTSRSYELEWNGTNNYGEKVKSGIYYTLTQNPLKKKI